jgi:hydrogenase maturation factor HypF (carbamoyltransferase family)
MNRERWATEEITLLQEVCDETKTIYEIMLNFPNKSKETIRSKINRMNLQYKRIDIKRKSIIVCKKCNVEYEDTSENFQKGSNVCKTCGNESTI